MRGRGEARPLGKLPLLLLRDRLRLLPAGEVARPTPVGLTGLVAAALPEAAAAAVAAAVLPLLLLLAVAMRREVTAERSTTLRMAVSNSLYVTAPSPSVSWRRSTRLSSCEV